MPLEQLVERERGLVLELVIGVQVLYDYHHLVDVRVHELIRVHRVLEIESTQVKTRAQLNVKTRRHRQVLRLDGQHRLETVNRQARLSRCQKCLGHAHKSHVQVRFAR